MNQQSQKYEDTGFPDHKERRESARAIVEYVVGKAIDRSMEVTGSYKELSVLIEELKQSPEDCFPQSFLTLYCLPQKVNSQRHHNQ